MGLAASLERSQSQIGFSPNEKGEHDYVELEVLLASKLKELENIPPEGSASSAGSSEELKRTCSRQSTARAGSVSPETASKMLQQVLHLFFSAQVFCFLDSGRPPSVQIECEGGDTAAGVALSREKQTCGKDS